MLDQNQQPPLSPFARPSARAVGPMPIQRGNYGIPPRQQAASAPVQAAAQQTAPTAPIGPRSMDIMSPPPSRPAVQQPQPVTPTPVAPQQPLQAAPQPQFVSSLPEQKPLFTSAAAPEAKQASARRLMVPKVALIVLVAAALLSLGGLTRYMTAGSTANKKSTVGAVVHNDGNTMTIQFTADDGVLHKFTSGSNDKYIPGMAVEVAYRSGAPDTTAREVAPIKAARGLGMGMFIFGLLIGGVTAVVYFASKPKKPKAQAVAVAQPVTV